MSDEDDAADWQPDEHLRGGEATILTLLRMRGVHETSPLVCFHFSPSEIDDDEPWGDQASYNLRARPLFDALPFPLEVDYVGGISGIEAWETVLPSVDWLHARVPALIALADDAGMIFAGWSFEPKEPRGYTFVSCGPHLNVFNANSPEGKAAIKQMVEQQGDTAGAKTT